MTDDRYGLFEAWLDPILEDLPLEGIAAFNFNIYEGSGGTYDIQLIGSEYFDADDPDRTCTSEENICYIPRKEDIAQWERGLELVCAMAEKYLDKGAYGSVLKQVQAVGAGFVDGDVT